MSAAYGPCAARRRSSREQRNQERRPSQERRVSKSSSNTSASRAVDRSAPRCSTRRDRERRKVRKGWHLEPAMSTNNRCAAAGPPRDRGDATALRVVNRRCAAKAQRAESSLRDVEPRRSSATDPAFSVGHVVAQASLRRPNGTRSGGASLEALLREPQAPARSRANVRVWWAFCAR